MMKKQGFTLIELLVVVAIIVVLISVLMPSLSHAREQVKVVACMSNVRQFGMAFLAYAGENQGEFPPTNDYHSNTGPTGASSDQYYRWWPNRIATIVPVRKWRDERHGNVEARDGVNKVWTCPALQREQQYNCGGYAVAENIVRYGIKEGGAYKFSQVSSPATLYLIGDAWAPNASGFPAYGTCITVYPPAPITFQGVTSDWALGMQQPARRHMNDLVPTAFYDGHAEPMKFNDLKNNRNNLFVPQ